MLSSLSCLLPVHFITMTHCRHHCSNYRHGISATYDKFTWTVTSSPWLKQLSCTRTHTILVSSSLRRHILVMSTSVWKHHPLYSRCAPPNELKIREGLRCRVGYLSRRIAHDKVEAAVHYVNCNAVVVEVLKESKEKNEYSLLRLWSCAIYISQCWGQIEAGCC